MKGLIIKDLMCLRKQRVTFIYIVVVVFIISIMFVLSARFGNIALANKEMMIENGMTDIDVKNLSSFALILFMTLPLALVGDVSSIFAMDGKAGFEKISSVMPISIEKRVLSRYITILLFFGIGVTTDLLLSFAISLFTDILTFMDFFKIIITVAGALLIYVATVCLYMFILGYGKESYALTFSILTIIMTLVLFNFSEVKKIYISIFSETEKVLDVNPLEIVMAAVKNYYLQIFIVAIVVCVLSYILSVKIAKRKRGLV